MFNYFIIRPGLQRIPPVSASVVEERIGTVSTYYFGFVVAALLISGVFRISLTFGVMRLFSLGFYQTPYGRAIAIMIFFWLVSATIWAIQVFVLRPLVSHKLNPEGNPGAAELGRLRTQRDNAGLKFPKVQVAALVAVAVAALFGGLALLGGLW